MSFSSILFLFFSLSDYLEIYFLKIRPTTKIALLIMGLLTKLRDENHTVGAIVKTWEFSCYQCFMLCRS